MRGAARSRVLPSWFAHAECRGCRSIPMARSKQCRRKRKGAGGAGAGAGASAAAVAGSKIGRAARRRDPNRPKRPSSPFLLFTADLRFKAAADGRADRPSGEEYSTGWKALDAVAKAAFHSRAEALRAAWLVDLAAYGALQRAAALRAKKAEVEAAGRGADADVGCAGAGADAGAGASADGSDGAHDDEATDADMSADELAGLTEDASATVAAAATGPRASRKRRALASGAGAGVGAVTVAHGAAVALLEAAVLF